MTTLLDAPVLAAANPATHLKCRNCSATYELAAVHVCVACFAPLEIGYDPARLARVTRASIEAGPQRCGATSGCYPRATTPPPAWSLGAGMTPLRRPTGSRAALGIKTPLWIKDDTANPTHSFKDRVVAVASPPPASSASPPRLRLHRQPGQLGRRARRPRRACRRSCSSRTTSSPARSSTTAVYGGTLVGGRRAPTTTSTGCAPSSPASRRPGVRQRQRPPLLRRGLQDARLRGRRAARLAAARADRRADRVGLAADQGRQGVRASSARLGLVEADAVRVFGAQADRLLPVATRLRRRHDASPRSGRHDRQVAGHRQPGRRPLRARRRPRAPAARSRDVTDDEVVEGIRLLAQTEGVFAETAGGVTVATLQKLAARRRARPGSRDRPVQHWRRAEDHRRDGPHQRPDGRDRPDLRRVRSRAQRSGAGPARVTPGPTLRLAAAAAGGTATR